MKNDITQICKRCKKELPITDFATNMYNELQEVCWDCADVLFEIAQEIEHDRELEIAAEACGGY